MFLPSRRKHRWWQPVGRFTTTTKPRVSSRHTLRQCSRGVSCAFEQLTVLGQKVVLDSTVCLLSVNPALIVYRNNVGQIFADLSFHPVWLFTCYNADASSANTQNVTENQFIGDFSPEELRWETYKAHYQGGTELNKVVCHEQETATDYLR